MNWLAGMCCGGRPQALSLYDYDYDTDDVMMECCGRFGGRGLGAK